MKYVLLLIFLLLLSCKKEKVADTLTPAAELYRQMDFYKGAAALKLQGPVHEVRRTTYHASGDTTSYTVGAVDTVKNRNGVAYLCFNKNGYLTKKEETSFRFKSYNVRQADTILTQYTFNRFHMPVEGTQTYVSTDIFEDGSTPRKGERQTLDNRFVYRGDTIKTISKAGNKEDEAAMRISITDSLISIEYLSTMPGFFKRSKGFIGANGAYYTREVENPNAKEYAHYEFVDTKLQKWVATIITSENDTTVLEYLYNKNEDLVSSRTVKGTQADSPYDQRIYQYKYDEHNNWVEKAVFIKGEARTVVRREISYY